LLNRNSPPAILLRESYAVRIPVPAEQLDDAAAVAAYKSLSRVERAFRSLKTVDLEIRPLFHYRAPRVRAHVFLCMLAYYVEWHLRARLAPMLYDDRDRTTAQASRPSPVAKAPRSPAARDKDIRAPRTACPSTASTACSPTSPPSPATKSPPRPPRTAP
jgi:hypothetical protein